MVQAGIAAHCAFTVLLANAGTTAELSALNGKGLDFKSDPSPRLTGCVRQNATPLDFAANAHGMAPTTTTSASATRRCCAALTRRSLFFLLVFLLVLFAKTELLQREIRFRPRHHRQGRTVPRTCGLFLLSSENLLAPFATVQARAGGGGLRGAGLYCLLISARPLGVMVRWPAASLAMKPRS